MKFVLSLDCDNDAVQTWPELAMILQSIAAELRQNSRAMANRDGRVRDVNGNSIGQWELS